MKKEDYLAALEEKLADLPGKDEKILYYSDYFDDFGDDEEASKALGKPEELAASILEKAGTEIFSRNSVQTAETESDRLYWEFPASQVKNLSLRLGSINAVIISGKNYSVETRGLTSNEIRCILDKSGTLKLVNSNILPGISYFSHAHERKRHFYPRVLITVPENAEVFSFSAEISTGSLKARKINFKYQNGRFLVLAGNLDFGALTGEKTFLRCAFGHAALDGRFSLNTDIDNLFGKVRISSAGKKDICSLDSRSILGKVGWGNEKVELFGNKKISGTGGSRYSLNSVFSHTDFLFED